jgi:CPA2 family monovalent cation:H+ antiporter-2
MPPDRRPNAPPPKYNPPRWVIDTGELVYYGTLALCAFTALFGLAMLVGPALLASGAEDPAHSSGDIVFLLDVCLVLMAALAGGLAARALRLPVLVGYLLAGVVVGPHTPGFTADERTVRAIADLGVALLMFAVGVQFSLKELAHVRRIAVLGGGIQIGGTIVLGLLVALALGWGLYGGLFLGCALALSSTAVIMRVLEERGEMGSTHGAALLGVSVVQDLSLVLMVALLPALAHLSPTTLPVLGLTLLKTVLFLGVALLLAVQGIPRLLAHAARARSPELFLLMTVCLCLAAAAGAHLIGLSLALGAFIAGIVISESEYAFEVIAQVRPLRDLFASLFFVSIGMLLDPGFVAGHWPAVLAVALVVVLGKFLLGAVGVYLAGGHARTALLVGAGLAQIGEFSFVLAEMGRSRNLIAPEIGGVILAGALLTVLVAPFLYGAAGPLFDVLGTLPAFSRLLRARGPAPPPHASPEAQGLVRAVVLGYGRVGHAVSDALLEQGVWHVVVDYDPAAIARLRDWGMPAVYGDASSEPVLAQALSPEAEIAVVALPEAATTERAVRTLRRLAPDLRILARVHVDEEIPRLQAAGANGVVYGEFETGTEMIRETLGFLGVEATTVDRYIGALRAGVVSEWDDRGARAAS